LWLGHVPPDRNAFTEDVAQTTGIGTVELAEVKGDDE